MIAATTLAEWLTHPTVLPLFTLAVGFALGALLGGYWTVTVLDDEDEHP